MSVEQDISSTRAKPTPLPERIVTRLKKAPASADSLASFLGKTRNSISVRLSELSKAGIVQHDGGFPATWSLKG